MRDCKLVRANLKQASLAGAVELSRQRLDRLDRRDRVRPRLTPDVERHRRLAVEPRHRRDARRAPRRPELEYHGRRADVLLQVDRLAVERHVKQVRVVLVALTGWVLNVIYDKVTDKD